MSAAAISMVFTNGLENVCRVCLCENNMCDSVPLFTYGYAELTIAEKLRLCCGIVLNREECLPQRLCRTCSDELDTADRFRVKCITGDEALQAYLREQNVQEGPLKKFLKKEETDATDRSSIASVKEEIAQEYVVKNEEPDAADVSTVASVDEDIVDEYVAKKEESDATDEYVVKKEESDATDKSTVASVNEDIAVEYEANYKQESLPMRWTEHTCPQCGKELETKSTLEKHVASMHKRQSNVGQVSGHGASRLYHCGDCEYTTRHSTSLVYHVRRHTGERPHRCTCGAAFTQPAALAAHARTHSDLASHMCATCGRQFKCKESFGRHQLVHSESKFSCSICGKRLKTQKSLESHMNRHIGLRNFNCERCGITFVTSAELANHRRKHDDSLRDSFQCHFCTYKTYAKKGLVLHLKRHTGDRPFKCSVCSYTAHTRGQLTAHTRTHTSEKRYACTICRQLFMHSSSRNKHVRRIHPHHDTSAATSSVVATAVYKVSV